MGLQYQWSKLHNPHLIDVGDGGGAGGAIAPPGTFHQGKTHQNRASLEKIHKKVTMIK